MSDANNITETNSPKEEHLPVNGKCDVCGKTTELVFMMTATDHPEHTIYACDECKNILINCIAQNTDDWCLKTNTDIPKNIRSYIDIKRGPRLFSSRWWFNLALMVVVYGSIVLVLTRYGVLP